MAKIAFEEKLRFEKYEVLIILGLFIAGVVIKLLDSLLAANPDMGSVMTGIIFLTILTGVLVYFINIRLETKVTGKNIRFRYFPNQFKEHKIKIHKIDKIEEVKASLAEEFSGWNVHFHNDEAYCPGRKKGVLISLTNGKSIFLGSKRPSMLKSILEQKVEQFRQ